MAFEFAVKTPIGIYYYMDMCILGESLSKFILE